MTLPITTVDCRGMRCPAPILTLSKASKTAGAGASLEILADDGDFPVDLKAWCQSTGATLSQLDEQDGFFKAQIVLEGRAAVVAPVSSAAPAPTGSGATVQEIDCRGMRCPAPILTVAKATKLHTGPAILRVQADDGDFPVDLEAWCASTGHKLLSLEQEGGSHVATVGLHGATLGAPAASAPVADLDLRTSNGPDALLHIGQHSMSHGQFTFAIPNGEELREQLLAWSAVLTRSLNLEAKDGYLLGTLGAKGSFSLQAPNAAAVAAPAPVEAAPLVRAPGVPTENKCTLLVLNNDFEPLMAALMVANASAAQGMDVEIFFSFWGVNVLRGDTPRDIPGTALEKPGLLKSMMKWMMPAGPDRQGMSKMNFGGAGVGMMKHFMKEQNILGIRELMHQAVEMDVKFVVCTMSMGLMGIAKQDLMDLPNIQFGGVTAFAGSARVSASSMVF